MNNFDDKFILDLRIQFCHDTIELLQNIESLLMDLEKECSDEKVTALKRELHCLKGNARAVGFNEISNISHDIESLCSDRNLLRGKIDSLLRVNDSINEAVKEFLKTQSLTKISELQSHIII